MQRIQRIGSFPLMDFNEPLIKRSESNFNSIDSLRNVFGCFNLVAASQPEMIARSFQFTSDCVLAGGNQVGIGVPITDPLEGNNYVYGISGFISFYVKLRMDISVNLCMGRLSSAPSITSHVNVLNPVFLPFSISEYVGNLVCSFNTQVINQIAMNGAATPTVSQDISLFWRIANKSGSANSVKMLVGRLSIHKYIQDLKTNDPNR